MKTTHKKLSTRPAAHVVVDYPFHKNHLLSAFLPHVYSVCVSIKKWMIFMLPLRFQGSDSLGPHLLFQAADVLITSEDHPAASQRSSHQDLIDLQHRHQRWSQKSAAKGEASVAADDASVSQCAHTCCASYNTKCFTRVVI